MPVQYPGSQVRLPHLGSVTLYSAPALAVAAVLLLHWKNWGSHLCKHWAEALWKAPGYIPHLMSPKCTDCAGLLNGTLGVDRTQEGVHPSNSCLREECLGSSCSELSCRTQPGHCWWLGTCYKPIYKLGSWTVRPPWKQASHHCHL